jgi:4-hydroxy-2-oxoheptanedioate aldolase
MTHSSLVTAWADGGAALGGWVSSGGEFALDLYRRAGYDYIAIDCQHTILDESDAAAMLVRAPEGGPAIIVRVSSNGHTPIGRVCDAGADGIIVPLVNTAEEAAAAVAATRYPPQGGRSYGPVRPGLPAADLTAMAERVSIFVMIETADGLANVEEICAVPGLTGVYVGPADLSIGLGLPVTGAYTTDQLVEPVARIRAACEVNGLILGMHQRDSGTAREWIGRGVRLAPLGGDSALFLSAAAASLADARGAALG